MKTDLLNSSFKSNSIESEDKSGIATFTFGDITYEIPLNDSLHFHQIADIIKRSKTQAKKDILEHVHSIVNILLKSLNNLDY